MRSYFIVAATIPLMVIPSWYCYDYVTPSYLNLGVNVGSDWGPYQHGLTIPRFLVMLGFQSFVALFSIVRLRLEIGDHNLGRKRFLLAAIGFASIIGIAAGVLKTRPDVASVGCAPRAASEEHARNVAMFDGEPV